MVQLTACFKRVSHNCPLFYHRAPQVVSQLNTFLVAAFETTASAIACCIYFIAQHPGVQEALLQEVDAFGRTGEVAYSDLNQVG
jgi:cytochrome P450